MIKSGNRHQFFMFFWKMSCFFASVHEGAGLEELGEEGVEEGGGEGVGEDEAVFPAVGPPAGGLDAQGLPEGAVFLVGVGGVEDLAEDAVDEFRIVFDRGEK